MFLSFKFQRFPNGEIKKIRKEINSYVIYFRYDNNYSFKCEK